MCWCGSTASVPSTHCGAEMGPVGRMSFKRLPTSRNLNWWSSMHSTPITTIFSKWHDCCLGDMQSFTVCQRTGGRAHARTSVPLGTNQIFSGIKWEWKLMGHTSLMLYNTYCHPLHAAMWGSRHTEPLNFGLSLWQNAVSCILQKLPLGASR